MCNTGRFIDRRLRRRPRRRRPMPVRYNFIFGRHWRPLLNRSGQWNAGYDIHKRGYDWCRRGRRLVRAYIITGWGIRVAARR